jgi:glycosyltransferase involved in cell wall biosynthesis
MTDHVHVITGLGMGGAETMLVQLAAALKARGLSQHVVSLGSHDALAPGLREAGIDVTLLRADTIAAAPGVSKSLVAIVNRLQPRILQGWMYHGNLAATLCHIICRGRHDRRLFWNLRASNMDDRRYGRVIRLSGLLSRLPEVVIANSEAGAEFHRARGFRPKRMVVIGNGVDTDRFRPDAELRKWLRNELGIAEDAVVVIHVARVDPMKDHESFLSAMSGLPAITGLMVGEGTSGLRPPPNVRALGVRPSSQIPYAAADIVASTSAFGEGFSNAIAEGMSAGLVPIATDVGDARRIVGESGLIVRPRDPAAFTAAIASIAALSETERRNRGRAARERIVANFTLARSVDAYAELCGEAFKTVRRDRSH